MIWRRSGYGWGAYESGVRWVIRGPIFGKRMWWLYRNGTRVFKEGAYSDPKARTWFDTAAEAKRFVAKRVQA